MNDEILQDNRICIVGLGYVGLTLAIALARAGFTVHGVEIDEKKLTALGRGAPHFYEQGLQEQLAWCLSRGRFTFSSEMPSGYPVYFITVGTPIDSLKRPNFTMIRKVAGQIAEAMDETSLVILRSTVAVGVSRNEVLPILQQRVLDPQVAFCSERTLEGCALSEIPSLPQVVGAINPAVLRRVSALFHRITTTVVEVSSLEAAELIKLLDNAHRDIMFAHANEVAQICMSLGLDGHEVIRAANQGYPRTNIALPGYVGGPCLEKDPYILQRSTSYVPVLVSAARALNEGLPNQVGLGLERWLVETRQVPATAFLAGMAFKGSPPTDDLRGAPSLDMARVLRKMGFALFGHDYYVEAEGLRAQGILPCSLSDGFAAAHVVIFMNNCPRYMNLPIVALLESMPTPAYFMDSWNMFDIPMPPNVHRATLGRR